MSLVDIIEAKDIDQLQQVLLGALDRLKAIVAELRDESEIEITVKFRRRSDGTGES